MLARSITQQLKLQYHGILKNYKEETTEDVESGKNEIKFKVVIIHFSVPWEHRNHLDVFQMSVWCFAAARKELNSEVKSDPALVSLWLITACVGNLYHSCLQHRNLVPHLLGQKPATR